jgi:flagellar hook-associated protein 3 FlgL
MRVSEFQVYDAFLNNLQRGRARLLTTQTQIASGKRVQAPSDDPIAFGRIVSDQSALAVVAQRLRTIQFGTARLDRADTTLSSTTAILSRLKELTVQLRDDTNNADNRRAGAREVLQLLQELQQLANTDFNGQPLFGGTSTHGRATGIAVTEPITITNGGADTLTVTVDGQPSGTIDLVTSTTTFTGAALAARLQSRINADAALSAAGKSVTVTFDTDHFVIASNSSGATSTVEVTGGTGLAAVGFNGGGRTDGAVPFAVSAGASADLGNAGGGIVSQATVRTPGAVTFDNYLIKFSSATTFDVYNTSTPVTVSVNAANTGGAAVSDRGVADPTLVRRDDYEIRLQSVFTVTSSNNALRFDPGSGPPVTVTLSAGRYTGAQLASAVQTAMNAGSGGDTYTVSFDDPTGKFTIQNDTGNAGAALLMLDDPATTAESLLGVAPSAVTVGVGSSASGDDSSVTSGSVLKQYVQDTTVGSAVYNVTSSNNTVYLNGSAVTLRTGSYTGSELAAELQTRLGTGFTAAYSTGAGRPARSFTITNGTGGAVTLNWSNAGATAGDLLGFEAVDSAVANTATDTSDFDAGHTAYASGSAIQFDGIRVALTDGAAAARNGDRYGVVQAGPAVLANQQYLSQGAIDIQGLRVSIRNGASGPSSGDLFRLVTSVQYQGNSGLQAIEIQDNQTVNTNVPGNQVFSGQTIDLFASIKNLTAALNGDYAGGIEQGLADIERALAQVSAAQGDIGAVQNRLTSTMANLDQTHELVSTALSQNQDADLVRLISDLTLQQYALQATAQAGSRIFETSLLNFLK